MCLAALEGVCKGSSGAMRWGGKGLCDFDGGLLKVPLRLKVRRLPRAGVGGGEFLVWEKGTIKM